MKARVTFLTAVFIAIACCFPFSGCFQSADRISVTGISLNQEVLNIQSGVTKTLIASVEPYFATNPGVIFQKGDDPGGIIHLANHRTLQPWEFAINVVAVGEEDGEASIIVKSLDGKIEKTVPVSMKQREYNLRIRNMNTGDLNANTTQDTNGSENPFEFKSWLGGRIPETEYPVKIRNNESGARINNTSNTDCFPNVSIIYLSHKEDGTGITGPFRFTMKFRFSMPSTSSDNGIFFGAYLDPEADLENDPIYQNDNPNANCRFRVVGFRFINGASGGALRNVFTTTGRPYNELGFSANPRPHGADMASGISLEETYTLQIHWDGISRWTNSITNELGITVQDFIAAGEGWQAARLDLADPNNAYYPAFHIAGVEIEIFELIIAE